MAEQLCALRGKGGNSGEGGLDQVKILGPINSVINKGGKYGSYVDFSSLFTDGYDKIIGYYGGNVGSSLHSGSVLIKTYPKDKDDTNWTSRAFVGSNSSNGYFYMLQEPEENNNGRVRAYETVSAAGTYYYPIFCMVTN